MLVSTFSAALVMLAVGSTRGADVDDDSPLLDAITDADVAAANVISTNASAISVVAIPRFTIKTNLTSNITSFRTMESRVGFTQGTPVTGNPTQKRQTDPGQFTLHYSREAIEVSPNETLYALPIYNSSLTALLAHAISEAATHPASELSDHLVVSARNFSVVLNSLPAMPPNETFNWEDFSTVVTTFVQLLKRDEPNVTTSFVGVVKDASGLGVAKVAIIPTFVFQPGPTGPAPSNASSGTATPPSPPLHPGGADGGLRHRAVRSRDQTMLATRSITDTPYTLQIRTSATRVLGFVLASITKGAIDMALMTYPEPEAFTSIIYDVMVDLYGDSIFRLTALRGHKFRAEEMFRILRFIRSIMDSYTRLKSTGQQATYRALNGRILDAAGVAVAQWSVGEGISSTVGCEGFLVEQPDGSVNLGCLVG